MENSGTSTITISPYNSSTGEGTLSYYANQYGTTVENLMALNANNPSVANQDTIYAGGNLVVPTPLIQSTTQTQSQTTDNINNLNAQLDAFGNAVNANGSISPSVVAGNEATTTPGGEGGLYSGDAYSNALGEVMAGYNSMMTMAFSAFDNAVANMDSATEMQVNAIKEKYQARVAEMEQINARLLGSKTKVGIRSGRARYASYIQAGILADEEMQGVRRISELHAEEMSLIAQARSAQAEFNYRALNDKMSMLDTIYQRKVSTINDLHKMAMDRERMAMDRIEFNNKVIIDNFNLSLDQLSLATPALVKEYEGMSPTQQQSFIQNLAIEYNLEEEAVRGAIEGEIRNRTVEDRSYNLDLMQENRLGTGGGGGGGTGTGEYSDVVLSWVEQINDGTATISNVPANLKNQVVQAMSSGANTPGDQNSPAVNARQTLSLNEGRTRRLLNSGINSQTINLISQKLGQGYAIEDIIQELTGAGIMVSKQARRRLLRYVDTY